MLLFDAFHNSLFVDKVIPLNRSEAGGKIHQYVIAWYSMSIILSKWL